MPFQLVVSATIAAAFSLTQPLSVGFAAPTAADVFDPPLPPLRILVSSAESGHNIPGAIVTMQVGAETYTVTADASGKATFSQVPYSPNLPAIVDNEGQTLVSTRMRVIVTVSAPDYLPLKKEHVFFEHDRFREMRLVPLKTGFTTTEIVAAKGSRLSIPKLGTLTVEEGALLQDTRLRITVIPHASTSPSLVEGVLRFELYLQTIDASGNPIPGLIASNGHITLDADLPEKEIEPAGAHGDWRSLHLGTQFSGTSWSPAVFDTENNHITMPLREGYNLLDRRYSVPDSTSNWEWTPWRLGPPRHTSTAIVPGDAPANILCGAFTNGASVKIEAGTTLAGSASLSAEAVGQVGWDAGMLFAKASAKLGLSLEGTLTGSVSLTTSREYHVFTPPSGTITGLPHPLSPPYSCISGTAHLNALTKTYELWAERERPCPPNGTELDWKSLGTMTISGGLLMWYDIHWDTNCPGCSSGGTVPPFPGDPTWSVN